MNKIEDRSTDQSAQETAGPSNFRKSQTLRLDKQIIRTLTGRELKIVGGATICGPGAPTICHPYSRVSD